MNTEKIHIVTMTQEEFNYNLRQMILETIVPYMKVSNTEKQNYVTNDDFMTRKEVAEFLGVSYPTLYKYIRQGKVPKPFEFGRKKMFSRSELLEQMENSRAGSPNRTKLIRKSKGSGSKES